MPGDKPGHDEASGTLPYPTMRLMSAPQAES